MEIITTISAAIAAKTNATGEVNAAIPACTNPAPVRKALKPPAALEAIPTTLFRLTPTFPTVDTTFPNIISPGPTAAAIAAHLTICFCCASSILLNLSSSAVIFSTNGVTAFATVSPTVYLNTSNDDFNFSTAPPGPDSNALAMLFAEPAAPSSPAAYFANVSGDWLISVIHFPIWFLPNIADAAAICSLSLNPAKESCSFFCMVCISSIFPLASKKLSPSFFIASAPSFAGAANLANPVLTAVAPSEPDILASPNTSVITAKSLKLHPTESNIGPATDIESNKSCTVVLACACAFASMSAASFAFSP